jgi:hypothetical protein
MTMTTTKVGRQCQLAVTAMLAVGLPAAGCGRGLFGISSAENRDASAAEVDPNPVPAGASVCFPDHPAACDQTCRDATRILWKNCAHCHGDPATAVGLPPWSFVTDPQQLTTQSWLRQAQPAIRFVLPGDPAKSAIYLRAVIRKDMPPIQRDPSSPFYPRVSDSDGQVLHDWIARCMGADPVDAGGPSSGDAVAIDATFAGDPGPVSCPSVPPSGACPVEHQNCPYSTQSCLCSGGNWQCALCPAQQPLIGGSCAAVGRLGEMELRCGYGSVSCSCDRRDGSSQLWGCGVCPAARPGDGAACGNASFSCAYGIDTCLCSGNTWQCLADRGCPEPVLASGFGPPWVSCSGTNACNYPALRQSCACTSRGHWDCSCPLTLPAEGSACAPVFATPACSYGDGSCTCTGSNGWHCTSSCPTSRPAAGDACSSSLSCTYGGGLCYCDGSSWQCS